MRFTDLLSNVIFAALLCVVAITPIPYGTAEPWWKAVFICGVLAIGILAIVEIAIRQSLRLHRGSLVWPLLALSALAFVQSWTQISADPFETRFVVLQLLSLTAFLALLSRYAATETRAQILIYVVLAVAVASAIFGILRQATQQQTGFILPLLKQNQGFAQFVNKNHFAYLMEMTFGLGLGILLGGGSRRDQVLIYVALLLPVWTGLILSNSRGGILAMLAQVIIGALFLQSQFLQTARLVVLRMVLLSVLVASVLAGTLWVGGDRLATNLEATSDEFSRNAPVAREGANRNEIWRATFRMFAAHPILGVGLGGYWIGITAYHDASGVLTPQEAHNDYLELLSSGGVIGFAIGIWFAVSVVRMMRKTLQADTGFVRAVRLGAVLGLAGVAAHSLVDFGLHITSNAVVFLTLIMMATTKIESRDALDQSY